MMTSFTSFLWPMKHLAILKSVTAGFDFFFGRVIPSAAAAGGGGGGAGAGGAGAGVGAAAAAAAGGAGGGGGEPGTAATAGDRGAQSHLQVWPPLQWQEVRHG